jgi:hypothetical protein
MNCAFIGNHERFAGSTLAEETNIFDQFLTLAFFPLKHKTTSQLMKLMKPTPFMLWNVTINGNFSATVDFVK